MENAMSTQPPTLDRRPDVWAAGDAYEPYVGRWSRLVAREFLAWLALGPDLRWLDVGCGTGALTQTILAQANPREVVGVDPSEGFIAYARDRTRDPRAAFKTTDARGLPAADAGGFDVAVAGLVLNFIPAPAAALAEMACAVRPGGTVACYVWDYAEGMQMMRVFWDAAVALDPSARDLDEGRRFPLCHPEPLRALFDGAGLQRTVVRAIDVPTPVHELRRLLVALPRRARPGADLLHGAHRRPPPAIARADQSGAAARARRQHSPERARFRHSRRHSRLIARQRNRVAEFRHAPHRR